MPAQALSSDELRNLVGQTHPVVPLTYPPRGLQPYYDWLIDALHQLAESSAGALRVARDTASPAHIYVAPGRCEIDGVGLAFPGQTLGLAAYNNDTALLFIEDDGGAATLGTVALAEGWPATPHLKLAAVTLAGGGVSLIDDYRFEAVFRV